jgi:hypothetical protein
MHYKGKSIPFSRNEFDQLVPLSPRAYRERSDQELNEVRVAAGLPVVANYDRQDRALQAIQTAAGIL